MLFELRTAKYTRRLKIEVRREKKEFDYQETIAFSPYSTVQVLLKALTLEQMMRNKIDAFLDRKEVRDCFDIEFLLRRGIELPSEDRKKLITFQKELTQLKVVDFKVKLGSIVGKEIREYYVSNRFSYLQGKLSTLLSIP